MMGLLIHNVDDTVFVISDAVGLARWNVAFPLNAALIHDEIGMQTLVLSSPEMLSNALRVTLGGAL